MPSMVEKDPARTDWRHRGACLAQDPELFFPIGNSGPALVQIEEAKAVCRRCQVREECLAWALAHPQQTSHGVWGGLDEDERAAELRRRKRRPGRGPGAGVAA